MDASKSRMLKRFSKGHPMMDSGKNVVAPKVGPDDDGKTVMGGMTSTTPNLPDRDGPAKRSAAKEPAAKKANGTSKATPMTKPKTASTVKIKKAPTTGGQMVQGTQPAMSSPMMTPGQMPPPNQVKAMKASLKASQGKFTR